MKFKKITALICVVVLMLTLFSGCGGDDNNADTTIGGNGGNNGTNASKTIGVVAKGESHAFWQAVKKGAEDAAKKYGYNITFRGPATESSSDLPSQKEMVQTALSNNVSGLVVATIGEGFADMLTQAYDKKIPVVQFDSGIWEADIKTLDSQNKNPIVSTVATSNKNAAALNAEHFFDAIKEDIAKSTDTYVIGVIQHDETQTGIDRVSGFTEKFTELADADETTKGKYKIEKEVKPGGNKIVDSVYDLMETLSEEDRQLFVDTVFEIINSAGASTFSEFPALAIKSRDKIMQTMKNIEPETAETVKNILAEFIVISARKTFTLPENETTEKINDAISRLSTTKDRISEKISQGALTWE